ncbi:MAG: hypothetical protein R2873_17580 [Caldilineaceae bacterium]
MQTSRATVDRLLDPENDSATLITLEKAALSWASGCGWRWWAR